MPASAVSSTLASTGWVGRLATARLTSWRLELSSDWEQTSFMAYGLGCLDTSGRQPPRFHSPADCATPVNRIQPAFPTALLIKGLKDL